MATFLVKGVSRTLSPVRSTPHLSHKWFVGVLNNHSISHTSPDIASHFCIMKHGPANENNLRRLSILSRLNSTFETETFENSTPRLIKQYFQLVPASCSTLISECRILLLKMSESLMFLARMRVLFCT